MTYESDIQPSIRLESFHLVNLDFKIDQSLWGQFELDQTEFKMNFSSLLSKDNENYFGVLFKVIVINSKETINLNFDFVGHFETKDVKLNDETIDTNPLFKNSAPAILFPYIRAFISNFTLNAGFRPLILPAINFHTARKTDQTTRN